MILVTVEILPGGFPEMRRTIAQMHIANVSDLAPVSDYYVAITEGSNPVSGKPPRKCTFNVRGHDRGDGVWSLVAKALAQAWCEEPHDKSQEASDG